MAAWETVTSAKLQRRMFAEWGALQRIAERAGGTWADIVSDAISAVVNRVRGAVRACQRNDSLGEEGSIPPELVSATYLLLRLELIATVPGAVSLNDETRKTLTSQAQRDLSATADCKLAITPPATAAASQPASAPGLYEGDDSIPWPDTPGSSNA